MKIINRVIFFGDDTLFLGKICLLVMRRLNLIRVGRRSNTSPF
jgi:hypothetical protein